MKGQSAFSFFAQNFYLHFTAESRLVGKMLEKEKDVTSAGVIFRLEKKARSCIKLDMNIV